MLRFEWDAVKEESNRKKHGISFETAKFVFDDPNCVTFVERTKDGEERWHAVGLIDTAVTVTVVHTYQAVGVVEIVRIISARTADQEERKLYAETL